MPSKTLHGPIAGQCNLERQSVASLHRIDLEAPSTNRSQCSSSTGRYTYKTHACTCKRASGIIQSYELPNLMKAKNTSDKRKTGSHLHPCATLLPNVVAVHDVEDLIPDGLGIATPAHTPQHVPHPLLSSATRPPMSLYTHASFTSGRSQLCCHNLPRFKAHTTLRQQSPQCAQSQSKLAMLWGLSADAPRHSDPWQLVSTRTACFK